MATTKQPKRTYPDSRWLEMGSMARVWLSVWPQDEPAVHRLKLTTLKIHPFGLQFEADHDLQPGTLLELRLLLPPMTAIALKGMVTHTSSYSNTLLTSVRFTVIREKDRKRLQEFATNRRRNRLRAHGASPSSIPHSV